MQRRRQEAPAAVKVSAKSALTNTEAEQMLSEYLDQTASTNETLKNQLKRVQRDLRGLPPLVKSSATSGEYTQEEEREQEQEPMDVDEDGYDNQQETGDVSVSKEERKRLKKERRKEEKRQKAMAATTAAAAGKEE